MIPTGKHCNSNRFETEFYCCDYLTPFGKCAKYNEYLLSILGKAEKCSRCAADSKKAKED